MDYRKRDNDVRKASIELEKMLKVITDEEQEVRDIIRHNQSNIEGVNEYDNDVRIDL